ncbi:MULTISPECIES: hypothetical protein [unclassified Thiomonas]|nr:MULTISPECIES: hypothetical protein [unclassified Thiomonas]VDY05655.1 protein of unknown function [Thiomonas sp. Bio17B3]VDY07180.1 protein of unknown function [Thiomonas sp. Sup16B3]VDY13911.1 protein of unknown function [Thiomonas sp. OC7]
MSGKLRADMHHGVDSHFTAAPENGAIENGRTSCYEHLIFH